MNFKSGKQLLDICTQKNCTIYDVVIENEAKKNGITNESIKNKMLDNLSVMIQAVNKGLDENRNIKGKIIGGEAKKIKNRYNNTTPACGTTMAKAISFALSTMEVNASMGKIVAAPTAGSCGIIPAVLLSLKDTYSLDLLQLVNGLFTSSGIGLIIAHNATLSGAQGGCQAEVGSASAMAAASVVELLGGSPKQSLDAASMALQNLLGLVCDPIAGLVESPCAKRNTIGTSNALICAEMALSGITSEVPFDETVDAMYKVGQSLPCSLRETALGGIAGTKTAKKIERDIFK